MKVTYSRHQHAGHYGHDHPARGHDLEVWTVEGARRPEDVRIGVDVPEGAEFSCGSRLDGVQRWHFVRRAPLSGEPCPFCRRCAARAVQGK